MFTIAITIIVLLVIIKYFLKSRNILLLRKISRFVNFLNSIKSYYNYVMFIIFEYSEYVLNFNQTQYTSFSK